jgi:hypothetical protein
MPHNKALQLTVNPLRGLSAAELRRSAAKAALYALAEKPGIICLSVWKSQQPGRGENKTEDSHAGV